VADQRTAFRNVELFAQRLAHADGWNLDSLLTTDEVAGQLRDELQLVRCAGIRLRHFRARIFEPGSQPGQDEFGPPPDGLQAPGRYSTGGGESVVYLGRTASVCAAEIDRVAGKHVFVQEFDVELPEVGVVFLDTSLERAAPALHHLLLATGVLPQPASGIALFIDPYSATQFLGALCLSMGIHAIEYPSIRGRYRDNPDHVNLVVLPPYAKAACGRPVGLPKQWAV